MRRVKSVILARLADDPTFAPGTALPLTLAERLAGCSLTDWWTQPGFQEWLVNSTEFRERLEGAALMALDALEAIVTDPSKMDNARVNAAKVLMELARKYPRQSTPEDAAKDVSTWDRAQLEEYVRKNAGKLLAMASPAEGEKP
jgi:hypothetical protein